MFDVVQHRRSTLTNEADGREPKQSRIQGEQILSTTMFFWRIARQIRAEFPIEALAAPRVRRFEAFCRDYRTKRTCGGSVTDKVFLSSYEDRGTASEVLLKDFGIGAGNDVVEIKSDETSARIQLSDSSAFSGQELAVAANFAIKPGWHIYGQPLPKGYVPTAISFDNAMVAQQSFEFPKPTPIKFVALGETLPAYTGDFKAIGKVLLRKKLPAGEHKLAGELKFQECNDQICKMPQTVRFAIPLGIEPINE
jgi:Disulphide bond corrector protein DsbC